MILAGQSWSQQIGLTGWPLALVIVAIIAALCFGAYMVLR